MKDHRKYSIEKHGALELSIGTIVIIVLGVSMLILGMVLIRNIMCSALGLTGNINDKVESEINRLFGSSGAEVACIGASGEPIKMQTGKENIVYCGIKAAERAQYSVTVKDYSSSVSSLTKEQIQRWITTSSWTGDVSPGDDIPKKAVRIKIPSDAPEGALRLQVEVKKNNNLISTQDLDFQISRVGFAKTAVC